MIFSLNIAVTGMRVPAKVSAALVTNGRVASRLEEQNPTDK
jgi:hypothetical protein